MLLQFQLAYVDSLECPKKGLCSVGSFIQGGQQSPQPALLTHQMPVGHEARADLALVPVVELELEKRAKENLFRKDRISGQGMAQDQMFAPLDVCEVCRIAQEGFGRPDAGKSH
jgi:hypothetical protein